MCCWNSLRSWLGNWGFALPSHFRPKHPPRCLVWGRAVPNSVHDSRAVLLHDANQEAEKGMAALSWLSCFYSAQDSRHWDVPLTFRICTTYFIIQPSWQLKLTTIGIWGIVTEETTFQFGHESTDFESVTKNIRVGILCFLLMVQRITYEVISSVLN